MRVSVSPDRCAGHGRCYTVAPAVFTADDEGYCEQRGRPFAVAPDLEAEARNGAEACPQSAISVEE
jgi:ferredoxin